MFVRLAFFLLFATATFQGVELRGKVVNQSTGKPISTAAIFLADGTFATKTDINGAFSLNQVPPGKYTLTIEAAKFWIQRVPIEVTEGEVKEFAISLVQQGARRSDNVEVTADVFGGSAPAEVAQMDLTAAELKQTDTVFAGDLFRSVQTLPGVTGTSNNDFFAQFMVLGADFSTVAMYIDDVLVRQPFHGISDQSEGASIGVIDDATVATVALTPLAYSEKYAEGTGGALSIRTREGDREKTHLTVGAGMAESHVTAEGGLPSRRGSWLVSGRKSYLGYLTQHSTDDSTTIEPSFSDLASRISYDVSPRQAIDFLAIGGRSQIDNSEQSQMDPNQFFDGSSNFSLVRLGWRAGITPRLQLSAHAAFTSQAELSKDQMDLPLEKRDNGEWVSGGSLSWDWKRKQTLEAGWTMRRVRGELNSFAYYTYPQFSSSGSVLSGTGVRQGGFVQQSSTLWRGRLQFMGGVRMDLYSKDAIHPFSPQFSGSLRVASATNLLWGLGKYRQFPDVEFVTLGCGQLATLVDTSEHYFGGIEQRIGDNTRIRLQGFERTDGYQLGVRGGQEAWNQALLGTFPSSCGAIAPVSSPYIPPTSYTKTHGAQIILQRRSSDRLSGWISYTLLHQRQTYYLGYSNSQGSMYLPSTYDGDGDQRNALNAFAMYRFTRSFNLSSKLLYGSGYPVFAELGVVEVYVNGQLVNQARTNPFLRADIRADKSFMFHKRQVTLHGEVLNVTDHRNMRFVGYQAYSIGGTWAYLLTEERSLGLTPTVGIELRF